MSKNGDELICEYDSYMVVYEIDDDMVVRDFMGVNDTLITNDLTVKVDFISTNNSIGIVKNLYLNFEFSEQSFSWVLHKNYGGAVYINNQENNNY